MLHDMLVRISDSTCKLIGICGTHINTVVARKTRKWIENRTLKSEARKDTNNPPDVEITGHSITVVWETIDAFRYHHRQLLVTGYFHCLCNHIE